ncbi:MAG TPA: hypothetical protein VGV63_11775 [Acidimicrobiales bacterium]|nr:hypothetical protein [Acidimicrobiales bacterium]
MDPVRAQRARLAKLASRGKRVGYLLFLAAGVVFAIGLTTEFTAGVSAVVTTCLVVGSIVLAPAIILAYAARAAERQDRERGV